MDDCGASQEEVPAEIEKPFEVRDWAHWAHDGWENREGIGMPAVLSFQ